MGRIIGRGRGIDRRRGRRIREGIGLREEIKVGVGRQVGLRAVIPVEVVLEGIRVAGRVAILGETGRLGIREGMLGIVLEILAGRLAIRQGIGPVVGMPEPDLVGRRLETPEEIVRVEIPVVMREGVDLQRITRVLRGILTQDFRREAIGHRGNHNHDHSHNRGRSLNLSNDNRRAHDRADLAVIIMPEQRGRRAIAVEPVPVAVAETGEVGTNEIARVDMWIDCRGVGGLWLRCFMGAGCGGEDVSYVSRGGEGICDSSEGE
jgi:hypothetical protein